MLKFANHIRIMYYVNTFLMNYMIQSQIYYYVHSCNCTFTWGIHSTVYRTKNTVNVYYER